ncbi:hypothetical protein ZWY2020_017328 [Hordeum vulgare]|nr:hypothetical protein ZWY2020_019796 [Hordeum vulgare]KAI4984698.1 hypothetical protein ZWY2020_017328 [Hordeum vulgare]
MRPVPAPAPAAACMPSRSPSAHSPWRARASPWTHRETWTCVRSCVRARVAMDAQSTEHGEAWTRIHSCARVAIDAQRREMDVYSCVRSARASRAGLGLSGRQAEPMPCPAAAACPGRARWPLRGAQRRSFYSLIKKRTGRRCCGIPAVRGVRMATTLAWAVAWMGRTR